LEKEVLRIREKEDRLEKQQKDLTHKLQLLEQHILQNNISFPIGYAISEATTAALTSPSPHSIALSNSLNGSLSPEP
jgi:hypothetical protein